MDSTKKEEAVVVETSNDLPEKPMETVSGNATQYPSIPKNINIDEHPPIYLPLLQRQDIHFIADDMVHVHVAVEKFFDNYKTIVRDEIEAKLNKAEAEKAAKRSEQNKKIKLENKNLKDSISDAISEIMTLKQEKMDFEKELLKVYTRNVELTAEIEKLKKKAEKAASVSMIDCGTSPCDFLRSTSGASAFQPVPSTGIQNNLVEQIYSQLAYHQLQFQNINAAQGN